ncbi:hypothetical protein JCM3774_005699 [Rhodotorula dairenensis]
MQPIQSPCSKDKTACSPPSWLPPTPQSTLVALPTSTLPVDHLVLLPPPALPLSESRTQTRSETTAPTRSKVGPGAKSDPPQQWPSHPAPEQQDRPANRPDEKFLDSHTIGRPRRSAAIAAARKIPRQPSPFDLEATDGPDENDTSPSVSPPPISSSRGAVGSGSRRKISHSLIERRRRDKINDCLATLRETVPSLREEGERKLARAKERGRKRGRGDEAGERGGLHKLEILQASLVQSLAANSSGDADRHGIFKQGTIAYIEDLQSQVVHFQKRASRPELPTLPAATAVSENSVGDEYSPNDGQQARPPHRLSASYDMRCCTERSTYPSSVSAVSNRSSSASGSGDAVDDHEASLLLLNFSTSPELRPML